VLFKPRYEGGAHVTPLGPDGIMLSVVNYVVIYFSLYHIYLGYAVRNVATVTLVTMVTKVTSVLLLLWLCERAGSVPLCRLVLSCYIRFVLFMFILNNFGPKLKILLVLWGLNIGLQRFLILVGWSILVGIVYIESFLIQVGLISDFSTII
jgi:hypothetical protein